MWIGCAGNKSLMHAKYLLGSADEDQMVPCESQYVQEWQIPLGEYWGKRIC